MRAIRQRYKIINGNLPHYLQIERELMGYSTEGAKLKTYSTDSTPHKVVVQIFGCRHQIREELYFWNTRLFFVYQIHLGDTGLPSRKIISRRENRFYFNQGRLVKWLGPNNKQMQITGSKGRRQERALLQDCRTWLRLVKEASRQSN